jgi:hypothetical protein
LGTAKWLSPLSIPGKAVYSDSAAHIRANLVACNPAITRGYFFVR